MTVYTNSPWPSAGAHAKYMLWLYCTMLRSSFQREPWLYLRYNYHTVTAAGKVNDNKCYVSCAVCMCVCAYIQVDRKGTVV